MINNNDNAQRYPDGDQEHSFDFDLESYLPEEFVKSFNGLNDKLDEFAKTVSASDDPRAGEQLLIDLFKDIVCGNIGGVTASEEAVTFIAVGGLVPGTVINLHAKKSLQALIATIMPKDANPGSKLIVGAMPETLAKEWAGSASSWATALMIFAYAIGRAEGRAEVKDTIRDTLSGPNTDEEGANNG